jgi:hypothetical protein
MVAKNPDFSKIKTIIESQILNTLDFLFTDNQIDETEVVKISRCVLSDIDTTTSTPDLFKNLRVFVNQYPLFKENIQKTITALNKSYAN